ncbi:MAG: FKBP-type peptidyl-prolyl cis-trans isomerase [Gammaproteobacteria bacterium]
MLLDGREFVNSSGQDKKPMTVKIDEVIHGLTEALQLMSVGSRWKLFMPPSLAYGSRSTGLNIPPNSTLIYEIELLAIGNDA